MAIRKAVFVGILATGIAGCSTTPVTADRAKPVPAARVFAYQTPPAGGFGTAIVTRDSGIAGSACHVVLSFNGIKAAAFGTAETATFYIPAGDMIAETNSGVCAGGSKETEVKVVQDQVRRYRIYLDSASGVGFSRTMH